MIFKMKKILALFLLCSCLAACQHKVFVPCEQVIDEGGLGKYPAIMTNDIDFEGYTIYRPADMAKAATAGKLPLVVFGNGGCSNSSLYFSRLLNEIASFGYVVVAVGPYHETAEEEGADQDMAQWTEAHLLTDAMNLMERAVKDDASVFYQRMDMTKVAVMGQSCGGLQALAVSADPRVKTTVVLNSGVIAAEGADLNAAGRNLVVDKSVLRLLHAPILYMVGGEEDQAYPNALDDYDRIDNVFAVIASDDSGHMGTYADEFGGVYGQLALRWLEWQLHNEEWARSVFVGEECICGYPGWDSQFKNIEKLTLP